MSKNKFLLLLILILLYFSVGIGHAQRSNCKESKAQLNETVDWLGKYSGSFKVDSLKRNEVSTTESILKIKDALAAKYKKSDIGLILMTGDKVNDWIESHRSFEESGWQIVGANGCVVLFQRKFSVSVLKNFHNVVIKVSIPMSELNPETITAFEKKVVPTTTGVIDPRIPLLTEESDQDDKSTKKNEVGYWHVNFTTTNNSKSIKWVVEDEFETREGNNRNAKTIITTYEANNFFIVVNSLEMGRDRIECALRHAIKLCGGKPNTIIKEPF